MSHVICRRAAAGACVAGVKEVIRSLDENVNRSLRAAAAAAAAAGVCTRRYASG